MAWPNMVFDRTPADLVYGNPRGYLMPDTLNRIEDAIAFITECADSRAIPHAGVERQKDHWTRSDYFYLENWNLLKEQVMSVRTSGLRLVTTPVLYESQFEDGLSIEELNNVERILFDAKWIFDGMQNHERYTNTFSTGSVLQRQYVRAIT